jgi:hypothetical protein
VNNRKLGLEIALPTDRWEPQRPRWRVTWQSALTAGKLEILEDQLSRPWFTSAV